MRKIIETYPNFGITHSLLGVAYEQQGKTAEAIAEFNEARRLDPEQPFYLGYLGHTYAALGKRTEAQELIDEMKREAFSVSRATGEDAETVIGNDTQMLAYSHAGHNCQIGSGVIITNSTQLSGHVVVEDRVVFSGMAGVIQFARIGTMAMVTGLTRILKDVPPYMLVEGDPLRIVTINRVGLQRAGISPDVQLKLRRAHRLLTRSGLDVSHALERIERELGDCPEVQHLVKFIRDSQARGMGIGR